MNAHGMIAEFEHPDGLLAAARQTYRLGYRKIDAYAPFPVEGLAEAIGFRRNRVPLIVLLGGIFGGLGGYGMMAYSAIWSYPLNVGGRPLHSWPAFVPITFELTVLCASLSAIIGMLALNGLPRPHHPVFGVPHFTEKNSSRFYLCVLASDEKYDPDAVRRLFESLGANEVWEVPQ